MLKVNDSLIRVVVKMGVCKIEVKVGEVVVGEYVVVADARRAEVLCNNTLHAVSKILKEASNGKAEQQ